MKRDVCPICSGPATRKPRPELEPHPYVECTACGFYYQQNLVPKVYEAHHEAPGDQMSPGDRQINQALAAALDGKFAKEGADKGLYALDIGSKYPWLSHCLGNLGWVSFAIDGIPEIEKFVAAEKLNVKGFQCDFELCARGKEKWPWDEMKFDLITLIHVVEHFYNPMETLQDIFNLMNPSGMLFIRCPDSRVDGIERDFTKGHYDIHPQIWNKKAFEIACAKIGFVIEETYTMYGQRDLILRKPLTENQVDDILKTVKEQNQNGKLNLGVGMIVKNEEKDLPECLDSIKNIADLIYIVDTGSTDNTFKVIQDWAIANGWQGFFDGAEPEVLVSKTILIRSYTGASEKDEKGNWTLWNFSKARNQYVKALDKLVNWLLWMDADDVLLEPEKIPNLLLQPFDIFGFGIVSRPVGYTSRFNHHRLWRTEKGIKYHGACHEYPSWPPTSREKLTELNIHHRWTHNPAQETGVSRNLRILERQYQNGHKDNRTLFYYANSLREAMQYATAITIYREYLKNPASYWDESVFARLFLIRSLRATAKMGEAYSEGFKALAEDQRFSEIQMELAYMYRDAGLWTKAIGMCYLAMQPVPKSQLFIEMDKYTDQPHRIAASCFKALGDWDNAVHHTEKILELVPNDLDMQNQLKNWKAQRPVTYRNASEVNIAPATPVVIQKKELHLNRPGAAGDILITLHAVEQFKRENPNWKIVYHCAPMFADLPKLCAAVDEVRETNSFTWQNSDVKKSVNLIGYPRQEGYPNKPMQRNLVDYFADEIGVKIERYGFIPQYPAITNSVISTLIATKKKIITFHVKAGWSPYKNWDMENWQEVIDRLNKRENASDYVLVQIGAKEDPSLENIVNLRGQLSLVESIQLIKSASLHLGVDSFSNHATAILPYTPGIILWGSTSPIGSGYLHNTNIWKNPLGCSPCYREYDSMSVDPKGKCPEDSTQSWEKPKHPCMQAITVDEVFKAVLEKLNV